MNNLNYQHNDGDIQLRQAVEQQLDLILKMEDQRKALRKQNKILHQKLKDANNLVNKYHKQTVSVQINTQITNQNTKSCLLIQQNIMSSSKSSQNASVQTDQQLNNNNAILLNNSKLEQAEQLLKVLKQHEAYNHQKQATNTKSKPLNPEISKKSVLISNGEQLKNQPPNNSKQITTQMINLTKQLNLLKKQLKQSEHRYKLREKQIKQLKKCIETKNEALQKIKKQFNQLSILMNSDKFKSVRNLEAEVQNLKIKLTEKQEKIDKQDNNGKLKNLLTDLTEQYAQYRKKTEKKVDILVAQLARKQKQIQDLSISKKSLRIQ